VTGRSVEELLEATRSGVKRVAPQDLEPSHAAGAVVVDIRPELLRAQEGEMGFGLVVERNVLEWRFDLLGNHTLPEVHDYRQQVVVVCSEGYASTLAAASLRGLGFDRATDLVGGYRAWRAWKAAEGQANPNHLSEATMVVLGV
jgi:rhodanese-related sulfurtransferase